jgi:thiosulfate dehydrogenase
MKSCVPVLLVLLALASIPVVSGADRQPADSAENPLLETIELGRLLVEQTATHPLTEPYVGASLNCTSCHLDNGTHPTAATFLEVATAYPAWAPREKTVVTLEDRVLNCFMRSCNGTRPPQGSLPAVAITAYITSLSEGLPMKMNEKSPHGPRRVAALAIDLAKADAASGKKLYTARCGSCHGEDGDGTEDGPPVWGPKSFNVGAGLSHVDHLAAWLKVAMPLHEADLTDAESLDIAAYVNSHDRPAFDIEEHLPPAEQLGVYNGKRGPAKAAVQEKTPVRE